MKLNFLLIVLALFLNPLIISAQAPWQEHGKLEVSSNGHYIQHEDDNPFLWVGDTGWGMFQQLTREEVANLPFVKMEKPWDAMPINQETAEEAFNSVLKNAGASYKKNKEVADISKITGIIDTQNDVGGWPELKSMTAPTDTDQDGMPNIWEKENGLNPNNPEDGNNTSATGYTMLEVYLNFIK